MRLRTTTAALLLALALPAAGATAAAPQVVPPRVDWIDPVGQVIHAGGRDVAITPPLPGGVGITVRGATGWYVKQDRGGSPIEIVAPDGTHVPSAVPTGRGQHAVPETGGTRAALTDATGVSALRIGDGALVARVGATRPRVLSFEDGTVTLAITRGGVRRTATWRPDSPLRVLGRAYDAPRSAEHGVVASVREGYGRLTVVPPGGQAWTVDATVLVAVSPNGRWAATYVPTKEDSSVAPGTLSIRRTATGEEMRRFTVALGHSAGVWEGNHSLLAPALVRGFREAVVRFGRDGTVQRATRTSETTPAVLIGG